MDAPTRAPSPLLRAFASLARWSLGLLLGAWLLLVIAWGAIHLVIVPRIGEMRPHLERVASQAVGVPVRIGSISAYSTGLIPAFELMDVVLSDPQGRDALRLPRILLAVSPQSLLSLQFDQLYVDSPTLDIRRAGDGRLFVAGLDMSGAGPSDDSVLDHVFAQPEFVIRHGAVQWTDELRGAPTIAMREVDLVMRNRGRRHDLRLDASPPTAWGDRFSVLARFEQPFLSMRQGRWREWTGEVHAAFSHVEVAQLKRYADIGVDLQRGRGALRAWVDVRRAQVVAATADVVLADVSVRIDPGLQPLELTRLSGRLSAGFSPTGKNFATEQLAFETTQGLVWPGGNVRLALTSADAARPARGEFEADRLDLAALAQIGGRLPLGSRTIEALARYEPRGLVERITARWSGSVDKITAYQVKGRAQRLHVRAIPAAGDGAAPGQMHPGSPGVDGAAVDFELTESGGKAGLSIQDGTLSFPGVFEEPVIPFTRLSAQLTWQIDGESVQVQGTGVRLANADTEGEADFKWRTSDPARSASRSRFPGVLELNGNLVRGTATRVHRYLPLVIATEARHYVRDAVQGGTAANVRFRVRGDLHDLPFDSPRMGEFSVSAMARDVTYAYVPKAYQAADSLPWPVLTQVNGELAFDRKSMRVSGVRASVQGASTLQVLRGEASIADLTSSAPVLGVGLDLRAPLTDLLSTAQGSPVAGYLGTAVARATATGSADLRLRLNLPLGALEKFGVQGSLALGGNDLQLSADLPRLTRARGTVNFTESGFTLVGLQGRALGGDIRIDGGSVQPPAGSALAARLAPSLMLRAQGVATAEGLRQARELGIVAKVAQWASGSTPYAASFSMRAGLPELAVSSTLAGMAINLPAPFAKPADTTLPLRIDTSLLRETLLPASGSRPRPMDQLGIEFGRVASVNYVRDLSGAEPRALRGAIGIGQAADESVALPADGVVANINMAQVDADQWSDILSHLSGTVLTGSEPTSGAGAEAVARSYLPQTLALRARELVVGGRRLHGIVAGASREGQVWRANVEAQEFNGYLEYRQALANAAGRVYARLSRLTLGSSSAGEVEKLLDDQPASIPALDIIVDDFELRGKRLGRIEIDAVNRSAAGGAGGLREWRLNRLDVITPEATLRASGNWTALNAQGANARAAVSASALPMRTVMNFRLDIQNSGDLLARFGMKDVIRRGKGLMEGQVAWVGSPLALDYASLGGNFNINIEAGQFLKADPGIAKLLGVLSLQSLPRRLALDFRDVFTEGFLFDFVRGDVRIEHGIATSNNLQMKGVNAAVLMEGQADLARETQDLQVVVVPEINAGTASLIATAINPAIGLGSFLAQWVLRRPLMDAATQEFHIVGSWQDPRITRVPRRAAQPGATEK